VKLGRAAAVPFLVPGLLYQGTFVNGWRLLADVLLASNR
jgi:hypothetical protein